MAYPNEQILSEELPESEPEDILAALLFAPNRLKHPVLVAA
jgi:hypothetical protein